MSVSDIFGRGLLVFQERVVALNDGFSGSPLEVEEEYAYYLKNSEKFYNFPLVLILKHSVNILYKI